MYNDGTYLQNNPTWHEEDAPFKVGKMLQLMQRNYLPFQSVVEVGCGSGEILVELSKLFVAANFTGFDISQDAIQIAKKKENERIRFVCLDFTQESTQTFDLMLVIDVIEHVEDYFGFLRRLAPKAKYTLFHIPIDMCLWSLFREGMLIESKRDIGHIHNYTEDFILSILQDLGYKVVDKIYTEPIFQKENWKQKIVNRTRKVLFKIHPRFCTKTIGGYSIMVLTENQLYTK